MKTVLVAVGVCLLAALDVTAQTPCQFTTGTPNITETCGNVGIGTTGPLDLLHVSAISSGSVGGRMTVANGAGPAPGDESDIGFKSDSNYIATYYSSRIASIIDGTGNGTLAFYNYNGGAAGGLEAMRIAANGNLGIGNPNPQFPLDVTGNIHATGNVSAGSITSSGSITGATVIGAVYQDVAEWVPATETMSPGTVVVLNPDRNNEVMPSARAYDTAVAGVVSKNPGVILGVAAVSKAQIATTGRVRVKVDATKQPIKVGDLLVTGERSGFAMKSIPIDVGGVAIHRPGTLIGKALEPLPGGQGEILVLLSLQ